MKLNLPGEFLPPEIERLGQTFEIEHLQKQVYSLEAAIEHKEQEIKEYQETIALLLTTIEREIDHEQQGNSIRLPDGALSA
jgi:peptidoglycan hydrolase CwlO-like protein